MLSSCDSLKVVYEFRKNLEDICRTNKASFDEIYASLNSWCERAKATGIDELENFAFWLEGLITAKAS